MRRSKNFRKIFTIGVGVLLLPTTVLLVEAYAQSGFNHPGHDCVYVDCHNLMSAVGDCGGGWCTLGGGPGWYKCMPNPEKNCNEDPKYGLRVCYGVCVTTGRPCRHSYGRCLPPEGGD